MFLEIIKAILMGIVEGITEWLPISSTGHMILLEQVVKFSASEEFMSMFRVVIQLGAILAVVVLFWGKLWPFGLRHGRVISKPSVWQLWFKVVAATLPVLVISPLDDWMEAHFYNYITVAAMLILYGVLFLVVESRRTAPHVTHLEQITYRDALIIGVWQMLAIIPGTSRSGATIVGGLLLVWQGVPQNFDANIVVNTLEGTFQTIAMGPIAALEIIKHLGTNGGGFLGANSTTPLENPTIISDMIELYSMMLFPGACVITFGKMVRGRKKKDAAGDKALAGSESAGQLSAGGAEQGPRLKDHSLTASIYGWEGRTIFLAMGIIFLVGLGVCYWSELQGNPALAKIGLDQSMGSMEGKEVRFGIAQSAMFTTTTTSFTTGTVNNMHDTLTPLGGMIPLLHMMLNVVFGGKGVGLMNMIMYAILAVFICGLMIGRTPEYLGKKIEGREMKLTALCIIIHPFLILFFSALAVSTSGGLEGITNPGFHGLSQVLYEYASSAANNGSGFEGLADNSYFWNITAGLAMFFGRYLSIVIQLAIAGSLMRKRFVNETVGTLRTDTLSFAVILVFVVYIFAALTFFPALALGPIAEHLTLWA